MKHLICFDKLNGNKRMSNFVELHHFSADSVTACEVRFVLNIKNNECDTVWAIVPYMRACFVS